MNSDTQIGVVSQFIIKSLNNLGYDEETALSKNFIANEQATYSQVDTASRALMELSTNTYRDTICITNISVQDILAG